MKLKYLRKKRKPHTHGLTKWEYSNYLRSKHWKTFRKQMKRKKKYECWICGGKHHLQLHHRSYKLLGEEKPNHVIWLCEKCHSELHATLWKNKNKKVNLWNIAGKMKRFRNSTKIPL